MSQDRSIHDLLERAVRDHSPVTVDPEQAVLLRARRERRRSVVLSVAATLVVVVGGAGVLNVVDTRTRGVGPVAGPGEQSVTWESGTRDSDQGDEAARREAAEAARVATERAAALAAAEAAAADGEFSVAVLGSRLSSVPAGWADFVDFESMTSPQEFVCSPAPRTLYPTQVLVGPAGQTTPCIGSTVSPYIWDTTGTQMSIDTQVTQAVLADGTPRWTQFVTNSFGEPVTEVYFPTTGQSVAAEGVPVDELVTYLSPRSRALGGPLAPEFSTGLSAELSVDGQPATDIVSEDVADLVLELRQLPPLNALQLSNCERTQGHRDVRPQWQIALWRGQTPSGFILVDPPEVSCAVVASDGGGVRQPTEALTTMLERLAGS